MEKQEILQKINEVFIDNLDNDNIALTESTTADDIEEWDSLTHVQLVVAVEKKFKIRFNAKEIQVNINQTQARILSAIEFEGKIFDGMVFQQILDKNSFVFKQPDGNPALITDDKTIINELIIRLHYLISISAFTELYFKKMNTQAMQLISFLQEQYHI